MPTHSFSIFSSQRLVSTVHTPSPALVTAAGALASLELAKVALCLRGRNPSTLDATTTVALCAPAPAAGARVGGEVDMEQLPFRRWTVRLGIDQPAPKALAERPLDACPVPSPWCKLIVDLHKVIRAD